MSDTLEGETATVAPPPGKAYVITGFRRGTKGLIPTLGVFTIPDSPELQKAPDKRMLENMGFVRLESIEEVRLVGTPLARPALYVIERTPAAKCVSISWVADNGSLSQTVQQPGQLHSMVPELSGAAADRYITPRNAPSAADLRNVLPPIKAVHQQKRQSNSRG